MKKFFAFMLALLLTLSSSLLPGVAESTIVDVSFRNMELSQSDLNSSRCTFRLSQTTFTQGSYSLEYTIGDDAATGLLVWNFYCLGQEEPLNIAGATKLQFDLYVPTDGYFDNIQGDARVQIDDADHKNAWGSSGGTASAASTKAGLRGLQAGWNHVSIPLDDVTLCTDMVDMRIYMGNSGAKAQDKIYVDDIRFVNDAADATITPLRNSAKDVIALISMGEYAKAEALYRSLSDQAKAYIPQDLLTTFGILNTPDAAVLEIPLMSFNIRQSEGGDSGMNHWNNRKEAVYDYLNNSGAHVMCLQEVKSTQADEITAALADKYTAVYYERDESANPEGLMNIYDNTLYDLVQQQIFWLSETPDQMSKGWGANYYRICVVTVLKHKQSGKLLNVFNVHLDHQVAAAQTGGMNLVLERLFKRVGHSVVMGDFNVTSSSTAYQAIAAKMKDCQATAAGADSGATYNGWKDTTSGSPIDFIFVNKENTQPQSFTICRDKWGDGYFYSDHYAVRSTVTFTYLSDDQKAAEEVIALIDALDGADKQAVAEARTAYDALTESQKVLVTNLQKLEELEKEEEPTPPAPTDEEMAAQVIAMIDALDGTDKQAIADARKAYNALTDNQKKLVTNLTKLEVLENPAPPAPEYDYGDVNGDDAIDAKDALMILQAAVDKVTLTEAQTATAEVSGDGKIDAKDALLVLQKAVDKIKNFPVEA